MLSKLLEMIFGTGSANQNTPENAAENFGQNAAANDALLAPIAGVSLEKYAELCAKMANTPNNDEAFAAVAEANGVSRENWEAARAGWNRRMEDTATAGVVAITYMPLYQAALAKYGGEAATATYEEYIEMSAMINTDLKGENARPKDLETMYARFNINPQKWSQISTHWVDKLTKDPLLGKDYADKCCARIKQLDDEYLQRNNF